MQSQQAKMIDSYLVRRSQNLNQLFLKNYELSCIPKVGVHLPQDFCNRSVLRQVRLNSNMMQNFPLSIFRRRAIEEFPSIIVVE